MRNLAGSFHRQGTGRMERLYKLHSECHRCLNPFWASASQLIHHRTQESLHLVIIKRGSKLMLAIYDIRK